jgi:FkbM family methyltransferase
MKNSHTLLLIEEAFERIQRFNYERYIKELENISCSKKKPSRRKHIVNRILEKFGFHLMRETTFEEFEKYNKMGKWSSVGTFQLALKNPGKFDEVYNLFIDEESKSVFDWFIQFRIAYAFLGEIAKFIFPPRISSDEFKKYKHKKRNIKKLYRNGFIKLESYRFLSDPSEVASLWVFEQYNLKGLCEVSSGDFVVDGGAFKGETSFWFLSKGARRIYAFEGDAQNFEVLLKNIKLNKVEDKIIPVNKLLLDKNGISKIKMTGTGSSSILSEEGTEIECITLDSFVTQNNIERIDFIKLDVEGAEINVLKGAIETIKKFKPKMAISVYHKPDDIITIPTFIHRLLPEAKFYLRHFSDSFSETILFVNPRNEERNDK